MTRQVPYGGGRAATIAAAIRLVARDGLSGLSFRALAAEASVSVGAVRHNFPTINDVLLAALDDCRQAYLSSIAQASDVRALLATIVNETDQERSEFEVKVMTEARHSPDLGALVERYYSAMSESMSEALAHSDLPSDTAFADLLSLVADGIIYQRVVFAGDKERHERHAASVERLLEELE
ncbi:TetR/AcrR family transcriptional regulator [Nocardia sp. NPDC059246]|uniref:TetR/AcrR family transcriptional regulator n=1 Tax=unclassified Nocardia TaxID=2637762 RepID=UPI00367E975E